MAEIAWRWLRWMWCNLFHNEQAPSRIHGHPDTWGWHEYQCRCWKNEKEGGRS